MRDDRALAPGRVSVLMTLIHTVGVRADYDRSQQRLQSMTYKLTLVLPIVPLSFPLKSRLAGLGTTRGVPGTVFRFF